MPTDVLPPSHNIAARTERCEGLKCTAHCRGLQRFSAMYTLSEGRQTAENIY